MELENLFIYEIGLFLLFLNNIVMGIHYNFVYKNLFTRDVNIQIISFNSYKDPKIKDLNYVYHVQGIHFLYILSNKLFIHSPLDDGMDFLYVNN